MVRHIVFIAAALALAPLQAAEPGKVVYAAGQVQVDGAPARVGDTVQDGALLSTGADGYLYVRTADQGLLIVRPGAETPFGRAAEPVAARGEALADARFGSPHADLDARKSDALRNSLPGVGATGTTRPPDLVPATPQAPQVVSWGRWAPVIGQAPTTSLNQEGARRLAANDVYVLFRSDAGAPYVTPARGSAGFALAASEATVRDAGTGQRTAATLSNGRLEVDFARATFTTGFDVRDQLATYRLDAAGPVQRDGQFSAPGRAGAMQVDGALGADGGATYLFQGALTPRRTISGVTVWRAGTTR
ncbi:MAG: hypothetical protein ABW069_18530 [Duganella sp.]